MRTKLVQSRPLAAALALACAGAGANTTSGSGAPAGSTPPPANGAAATPAPAPATPAAASAPAAGSAPAANGAPAAGGSGKKLNKYTGNAAAIQAGRNLYLQNGCSGCHGGGGGGGMAPPLIDDVWKFGSDDATLFKLIKGQIPEQTMPKVYAALPDDDVWKMLAYIRSIYAGDPQKVDW